MNHSPNIDREAGDELHDDVSSVLHIALGLVKTLTNASNAVPHVRIDGRPLGILSAEAAEVWNRLDAAHRRYLTATMHRRAVRADDIAPAAPCAYCRGAGELEPLTDPEGAPAGRRDLGHVGAAAPWHDEHGRELS